MDFYLFVSLISLLVLKHIKIEIEEDEKLLFHVSDRKIGYALKFFQTC